MSQVQGPKSVRLNTKLWTPDVGLWINYLTSTVAPASVSFCLMVSASSFETPSFTDLGAASTRSLASFKPNAVTSRTTLITLILLPPIEFSFLFRRCGGFSTTGASARSRCGHSSSGSGNAKRLFHCLYQLRGLKQRSLFNLVNHLL